MGKTLSGFTGLVSRPTASSIVGPPIPSEPDALETMPACRMADAEDLKSSGGNPVWVRFPPPVMTCDE